MSRINIKRVIFICGFIFSLLIFFLPINGLSPEGKKSIALFILIFSMWVSNIIPLAVTGLLVFVLIPVLGILSPTSSFSLLGNRAVFFILGAFILSGGIMKSGLSRRVAMLLIRRFSGNGNKLLIGIFLTSGILSFFMPEHAVAAILFPVILEIAHNFKIRPGRSKISRYLFLSMAWGCVAGGVGTMLGGARAPLAAGLLYQSFGINIGFIEWAKYSLPVSITILVLFSLYFMFLKNLEGFEVVELLHPDKKLKPIEIKTGVVFLFTLILWVFFNRWIDISVSALIGAVLLFIVGVLKWKEVEEYVNWGIILMYGGAIALGESLLRTGAADYIARVVLSPFVQTYGTAFVSLVIVTIILTEGMSNVAAASLVLPIGFGVARAYGYNPVLLTLGIGIGAGLAFLLPTGTPPNAIALSSNFHSVGTSIKKGLVIEVISIVILIIFGLFVWPHMGVGR